MYLTEQLLRTNYKSKPWTRYTDLYFQRQLVV